MIDELDKIHPKSGDLIPLAAGRLPPGQPPLECREPGDLAARGAAERVRGLPGRDPGAAARPGRGPASRARLRQRGRRQGAGRLRATTIPCPRPRGSCPIRSCPWTWPRGLAPGCQARAAGTGGGTEPELARRALRPPRRPGRDAPRHADRELGPRQPSPGGEPAGLGLHAPRPPELPAGDEQLRAAGERAVVLPPGASPPDGPEPAALQPERPGPGGAPRWDGRRLDWTGWDRRFGPLLDGSAFADLPRKGVPVECFYLPLHENWPSPMEGNYNGSYWADQAFPESYRRAFVSASRQIAEHLRARGWNDTLFHGFLNNKNNFKANGWSRGSSPGPLDEPANFQDYRALRYFGQAFHEGINQARPPAKGEPREPRRARKLPPPGLPRGRLAPGMAPRRAGRPGRLSRRGLGHAAVSPAGLRPQAAARRDRGRVRRHEPGAGLEPPARELEPRRLVAGGRRRAPLADDRHGRLVAAGRRAGTLLPRHRRPVARPTGIGSARWRPAWSPRSGSRPIAAASKTSST